MEVKRSNLHKMFEASWCVVCGDHTDMKYIQTGMPGIQAKECACGACFQANYLEDPDDVITLPDTYKLMNISEEDDANEN